MDDYVIAFKLGRENALAEFSKEASPRDVALVLSELGGGISSSASAIKNILKGGGDIAKKTLKGTKGLGTLADPRMAGLVGGGTAIGSIAFAKEIAPALKGLMGDSSAAVPAVLAALGGGLALGANPGMLGGSVPNRIAHEIAQNSRTPAGLLGAMAGMVGVPAALYTLGKMKGREENSLF